jgi:hypothetical protein
MPSKKIWRPRKKDSTRANGPRKKWTVLVWIAGDNDLDEFGLSDLKEMKKVGSNENIDIVAQFDRAGKSATRRYHLKKGTTLAEDMVADLGETNTGDPAVAIDFFTWGIKSFPADRVMTVIWNHGSGIDEADVYRRARRATVRRGQGPTPTPGRDAAVPKQRIRTVASSRFRRALFSTTVNTAITTRAIAYDDTSRDFLDNAELKKVLAKVASRTGRSIDVLGLDACLMNMVEVAYQLRDFVGHIVASEELEPGDGWPYDRVLKDLDAKPTARGAEVSKAVVARYLDSYVAADAITSAALDVARVESVAKAVDRLAGACMKALADDSEYVAFSRALKATQRFDTKDFVDLGDFCAQLASRTARTDVKKACAAVTTSLSGAAPFVLKHGHKGAGLARATGAAIYFPTVNDAQLTYDTLDFAKDTRWGKLIARYQET